MDVLVAIGPLVTDVIGAPSIAPDHHPRTLLMAEKTSSGVWSIVKTVVKF
jgi:hypothetical protein